MGWGKLRLALKANPKNTEEKWALVKQYYEGAYRIQFPKKLSEEKIEFLWQQMIKLGKSFTMELERGRPFLNQYLSDD